MYSMGNQILKQHPADHRPVSAMNPFLLKLCFLPWLPSELMGIEREQAKGSLTLGLVAVLARGNEALFQMLLVHFALQRLWETAYTTLVTVQAFVVPYLLETLSPGGWKTGTDCTIWKGFWGNLHYLM